VKKLQVLTTDVAQDQFIQEWVDTWIKQKRNITHMNYYLEMNLLNHLTLIQHRQYVVQVFFIIIQDVK
jgi:hypothetical protein